MTKIKFVVRIDGRVVATFGSALKDKAEQELRRVSDLCFGTNSFPTLTEEVTK